MFEQVLIGVDGHGGGRDAIRLAETLAPPDARLTLVHVYSPLAVGRGGAATIPLQREDSQRLLERAHEACPRAQRLSVFAMSVGQGLHETAEDAGADLLVVGSCHHGMAGRVLLGDHTRDSLSGAPCAIAIAPRDYAGAGGVAQLRTIAVGHDGSAESERALALARWLAGDRGATVEALRVATFADAQRQEQMSPLADAVDAALAQARRELGELEGVVGAVAYGDPGQQLARLAEHADLLIVGSRGYGPLGRVLHGSVSTHLARRVPCALLVVPRAEERRLTAEGERRAPTTA